jgi:hypothetical protein
VENSVKVDLQTNKLFVFIFENLILAIRPSRIDCTDTQLFLTVILDDIDPDDISLGDDNCKPIWANDTHAHFISHIDNCSLVRIQFNREIEY